MAYQPGNSYRHGVALVIGRVLVPSDILLKGGGDLAFNGSAGAGQRFLYSGRSNLVKHPSTCHPNRKIRHANYLEKRLRFIVESIEALLPYENVYSNSQLRGYFVDFHQNCAVAFL